MDFCLFLKIWAKVLVKIYAKTSAVNIASHKLLDHTKQSATNALKPASKRTIQKTAGATVYLIGDKIADKITKISKHLLQNTSETVESETEIPRERYMSPEERQQIIHELG